MSDYLLAGGRNFPESRLVAWQPQVTSKTTRPALWLEGEKAYFPKMLNHP